MKEAFIGAFVAVVILIAGFLLVGPAYNSASLGSTSGTTHSNHEYFSSGVTLGGRVFSTSSIGTATYTAASLTDVSLIQHTAASALTVTLPASSTFAGSFAPKGGDVRSIYLAAITTNITLAGGTGTDLDTASSTKVCAQASLCRLDFVRKSNSDFEVLLTSGF